MFSIVNLHPLNHYRKDQKKISKLEAQIPYYQGRNQPEEVEKVKEQIADIWAKARQAA
jgi:hypothetical protein